MTTALSFLNILHPGFIMIVMSLAVLLVPKKYSRAAYITAPVLALAASFLVDENSSLLYNISSRLDTELMSYDGLSRIFLLAYCIISLIAAIYASGTKNRFEMAASLVYAGSNMAVVLAGDCISVIIFWELSALASAYLVYSGNSLKSTRAAFRYLLVHAFGGGMLLAGLLSYMNLFEQFGGSLENISGLAGTPTFWIIFIGVAVNAAVPPINSWLPDAYPESTLGGTIFLGSFTTKTAIYLFIRMFAGTDWMVWIGAFMAIYGAVMALLENDLRRLFCYHIISQLGYMIASLAVDMAGGVDGAAAHAFNHIMYKGTLLMCAGAVIYATGKRKISELGGLGKKMPVTSACFLIASLSISGFPFLNGFASKALIMHAVEESGHAAAYWLLTAASVGTWLSIALKVNYFVFWKPTDKNIEVKPVPMNMKIGMIAGSAMCIATGLFPNLVYNITPYGTDGHPFTLMHILEYLILFTGATAVFWKLRKIMEPHDEISLDFDWIYRKGLNKLVLFLSRVLHDAFDYCGVKVLAGVRALARVFSDPYILTRDSEKESIRDISIENEDQTIGDIILPGVIALAIIVIIGVIVI